MVGVKGLEPSTPGPKQVRYQTALHSVFWSRDYIKLFLFVRKILNNLQFLSHQA